MHFVFLTLVLSLSLSGCGSKGPLFLPNDKVQEEQIAADQGQTADEEEEKKQ